MNLEQRTKNWVSAQIIDQSTADKILQFESNKPTASWVMFGVAGIGVTVVVTGIISLVASNWDSISDLTKQVVYFLLLMAVGFAAVKRANTPGVVRETLFILFAGMVITGIGLAGQIYNLESDGYSAIFFWLALILPLTICAAGRLLNHLWFAGLCYALVMWSQDGHSLTAEMQRFLWLMGIPFAVIGVGYSVLPYLSTRFAQTARIWSYAALLVNWAITANIAWAVGGITPTLMSELNLTPILGGIIIAIVCVYTRNIFPGRSLTMAIIFTLLALALLIIPPFTMDINKHRLVGCALFILSWSGAAAIAAISERKRLFDLAAFVIGIRFIVVYFEVFGSLAATGIGLIISGLVILGIAYLWHHYRGQIAQVLTRTI